MTVIKQATKGVQHGSSSIKHQLSEGASCLCLEMLGARCRCNGASLFAGGFMCVEHRHAECVLTVGSQDVIQWGQLEM